MGPAAWRGTVTVAIAALISTIGAVTEVAEFLFRHPEFVLVEIGAILLIATHMKWGLFEKRQPDSD